jgi:pre-rRNA-processing protein TSR1
MVLLCRLGVDVVRRRPWPRNRTDCRYAAYLKERERAAREDAQFPDELDTPRHIPARTRFQRYRGLKSFRTSPWDPYENLPIDYAKNYMGTKRRIERDGVEQGVKVS